MFKIKRITGPLFKQRMEIKGFRSSEAMHSFLNIQYSNEWWEYTGDLTPGIYAFVAQHWINVRKLDASVLAHV